MSLLYNSFLVLFILFISIQQALSAKYDFKIIPWYTILVKIDTFGARAKFFGGRSKVNEFLMHLFIWSSLSITIILLIANFILEPILYYSYRELSLMLSGKVMPIESSVITIILSVLIYLDFIRRSKITLEKNSVKDDGKDSDSIFIKIFSTITLIYTIPLTIILNAILLDRFSYFYKVSTTILDACGIFLVDKYEYDTCLKFINAHLIEHPNEYISNQKDRIAELSLKQKACALITIKISHVGFYSTENFIYLYKEKI